MSEPEALTRDTIFAHELRGFGPVGVLAILVILVAGLLGGWAGAAVILLWAYRSGTPWRELGLARPKSWTWTVIPGILLGAALKLLNKSVLLPLFGASPTNQAYHFLVGNPAAVAQLVPYILVSAAVGEEILYRGYPFERLGKLLGGGASAKIVAIVVTAVLFGLAHLSGQGRDGAIQGAIVGVLFGAAYAASGNLWLLMFTHASFDLTAVAIIYFDVETRVAHLFFH